MSRQLMAWEGEEKKLQSVFDDVSYGRIPTAQQTLTRYLKKHPKSQPALIIKFYIAQKTGVENDELIKLFKEIQVLGGPKKEMTGRGVWWCAMTLRNMGRLDLALKVYQDLHDLHPETLQLLEQVFLHAAAAGDVPAMVQSSRKMFNTTRDSRWARTAAWAEWYQKSPQPTPTQPYPAAAPENTLKIAQVLLSTTGAACETSEIFWLRTQIMLSNKQYSEIFKIASEQASEGGLARLWWRMEVVKAALERAGEGAKEQWEVERGWVAGLLEADEEAQHNYAYYKYLIRCTQQSTSEAVSNSIALLNTLDGKIGHQERAPKLARLELDLVLRQSHAAALDDKDWSDLVNQYWAQWGSKGSIITELEGIVQNDDQRRESLCAFTSDRAADRHQDQRSYAKKVHAEIMLFRSKDAEWLPAEDDVVRSWKLYIQGLEYGKNLPKTDVQPADQIGLVTVNLLIILWHSSRNVVSLYKAILALEKICANSPVCMHAHYLLIRLYRLIGAPSLVKPHLEKLNVSEIQLDNLLHVVFERGAGETVLAQSTDTWSKLADKAVAMYKRSATDFPEYIKDCLSNETYSKIPSIQYLNNALSTSLSSHVLTIEEARFRLHTASSPSAALPKSLLARLEKTIGKAHGESDVADLRNWELIAEIGGNRPLTRRLTRLGGDGPDIEDGWVRLMGRFWLGVGRFLRGDQVGEIIVDDQALGGLLPSERALLKNGSALLNGAAIAIKPSGDEGVDGSLIQGVFDENIKLCLDQDQSRWSLIQSFISLAQLIKISDGVLSRVSDLAKPTRTKKASPTSTRLTTFIADLKAAQEARAESATKLEMAVVDLEKKDMEQVEWRVVGEFFDGDDQLGDIFEKVVQARKQTLQRAKNLVTGKK